jgi:hypothetical protein
MATFVGARAVTDPTSIRIVVAAFATPTGTGLSALAGRALPVGRWSAGGVMVRVGPGGRRLRLPIAPGTFTDLDLAEVRALALGEPVEMFGPGVLAFDGERDRRLGPGQRVTVTVEACGPLVIDVERTLMIAATQRLFDRPGVCPAALPSSREAPETRRSNPLDLQQHDTETFDGH